MHKLHSVQRDTIACYVKNLVTGTTVLFPHVPDEISVNNSAEFGEQAVRGRSEPYQGYDSSGPRNINVTVTLHDDYCPGGIENIVNKLEALVYPGYRGVVQAPRLYFRVGKTVRLVGVCNSVSINWKKPYRNGYYISADVTLDFKSAERIPFSATEIEGGVHNE